MVAAIVCRLLAPSWQFEGLVEGEPDVSLTQWSVRGQRQLVVCEDPEVLDYLHQMMVVSRASRFSDRSGDAALLYSMNFRINGGMSYRVLNCYVRGSQTGVFLLGDPELFDGWPNLDVEFRKPKPENFDAILDFLVRYDDGLYQQLHCTSDGEIVISNFTPE